MRESYIESALAEAVKAAGGVCRKVQWIGRRGAPDRVVMLRGKTIWVELKAPGQKAKPHQQREHARMRSLGQTVVIIDQIEQIKELLK